jgi:arsenate reductase
LKIQRTMTDITIFHNPQCSSSRKALALIRETGEEPTVLEYLKTPPSSDEILSLVQRMGGSVRDVLRQKGTPYDELDLGNPQWTDAQLLDFIAQHPILIQRPIVATPMGVRVCRPAEVVLDILPKAL